MVPRRNDSALMLVAFSAGLAVVLACGGTAADRRDGPTAAASASLRLAKEGEPGDPLVMTGRILDTSGQPIPGATLSVYHADANGAYAKPGANTPRLSGRVQVGADGAYRIETVVPSQIRNQEGGPPHIHGSVFAPGRAESGFVINLTLAPGQYDDARDRASRAKWGSWEYTIYQDRKGTWWLFYEARLASKR